MTDTKATEIKLNDKETDTTNIKEQNEKRNEKKFEEKGDETKMEENEEKKRENAIEKGKDENNIEAKANETNGAENVNEKKGKEKEENGTEKEEGREENEAKPPERQGSTFGRFLSWWRGKPNNENNLKDEKEREETKENEDEKKENVKEEPQKNDQENDQSKYERTDVENATKAKSETENSNSVIEMKQKNERNDEKENIQTSGYEEEHESKITKTDTLTQHESSESSSDNAVTPNVKKTAKLSTITDRRLEKILEEAKNTENTAPLAQPEEDTDSSDSQTTIDSALQVSAHNIVNEPDSKPRKSVEVRSENPRSTHVKGFVGITDYNENKSKTSKEVVIDSCSDVEGVSKSIKVSGGVSATGQDTQSVGKHNNTQSNKMEEVIEEKHHDVRRQNVSETWSRIDPGAESPKDTGKKSSVRISYTIRTETIEKSRNDDNDDDDEVLFGKDVLLNSAPTRTYAEPPPEDLEPEIVEENAREEESSAADIDRFFEQCKEDGSAPLAKDETETDEKDTRPKNPDDIFKILHGWDDEPTDWWTITKKKKEYEEWMKPMKHGTIRRVIIPNVPIPYKTSVAFITDWKCREEWDKTFSEIQVIKSDKSSKIIYCPVKNRDLTFETNEQEETDPPCYVLSWKKQETVKNDETTKDDIQLITHACGIILRPAESGENATKITILAQLEGEIDEVLKKTFLTGHPKTWLSNLKKYYKKQQKGDNKKVVYL